MKKITKKQAEILCFKADNEGVSYAIQNGYLDAPGTELEPLVNQAKDLLDKIDSILEDLREKYDISES